jgi:hypothetical protein
MSHTVVSFHLTKSSPHGRGRRRCRATLEGRAMLQLQVLLNDPYGCCCCAFRFYTTD